MNVWIFAAGWAFLNGFVVVRYRAFTVRAVHHGSLLFEIDGNIRDKDFGSNDRHGRVVVIEADL